MPTKKEQKAAIIAAGRKYLKAWLLNAMRSGRVYYDVARVSRSGMSRDIKLYCVRKGEIEQLWPHAYGVDTVNAPDFRHHSDVLDIVARDWGFNFDRRCFVIGGCGMDMVFALVDDLKWKAGLGKTAWERKERNGKRYYVRTNKPMGGHVQDFTNALSRESL